MNRVDPINLFRLLYRIDIGNIDNDGLVVGSHKDAFQNAVRVCIYLLMWHERRNENEVTRASLGNIFETVAPTHARFAPDDEDYAFQFTMMMDTCFGIRFDGNSSCPDFLGADASLVDRRLTKHSRRLRGIGVKLISLYHTHTIVPPAVLARMIVIVIGQNILL